MNPRSRHGLRNALVALALLCVGGVLLLRTRWAADHACELARGQLPRLLGVGVRIDRCEIQPLTQTVVLEGFALTPQSATAPLFSAESAEISLGALHPWFGELQLSALEVHRPRLSLDLRAPAKSGGAPRCPLPDLARVRISRLEVDGGALELLLPGERRLALEGVDLAWKQRRGASEFRLGVQRGELDPGGARAGWAVARLSAEGALDVEGERLDLTRFEGGLDDVSATVSGRIEQLCDPSFYLDGQLFVPVGALARAAGTHEKTAGHLWARVAVSGRPADPTVNLELVGNQTAWGHYKPGDFEAKATYERNVVTVHSLDLPAGPGVAHVSGRLELQPGLPVQLALDADQTEFARVLDKAGLPGAWADFFASGNAHLAGRLRPLSLAGEADLAVSQFELATRAYDAPASTGRQMLRFAQGRVSGPVRILSDRVEFPALEVSSGKSRVSASVVLHYASEQGLSIAARGEPLDLSDFGEVAGFATRGVGQVQLDVEGPYHDVKISGNLSLRDLEFWDFSLGVLQGKVDYRRDVLRFPSLSGQKGKSPYYANAELTFGKQLLTQGELVFPRGQVSDLVDLLANVSSSIAMVQGDVGGMASARVAISGPAATFSGEGEVALSQLTYLDRRLGDGTLKLGFENGELMRQSAALSGPLGRTSLEGTFHFDGPLDYRFSGEGLQLAELLGVERAKELDASGTLALSGTIEGDSTTPVLSAYLTSPKVLFAGRDLGSTHLEARMQGRELQIWGTPFDDARGFVRMKARAPYPYQTHLSLALPEIRPLLPTGAVSQGLSGALSGTVDAEGTLKGFADSLKGTAKIDQLRLSRGDFSGANDGPISLAFERGHLELERFSFRGPNTELMLAGGYGPEALDLKLHGTLDMRLLESFVPQLERTSGKLELTASAQGKLDDPQLSGSAELRDVRLSVKDAPANFRGISGRLEFSEARVLLQDLRGVLNDGRVAVRGDLELQKFKPRSIELGLQLDEVTFRATDELPLTTSGELLLTGKPDALRLSGSVDVSRFRYDKPLVLEALIKEIGKRRSFAIATSEEKPREWLGFDVAVHLNDVRVDNNLAKARLLGDLRLTGTNVKPGVLGTVTAAEGSQVFFRSNGFAVDQAILEFKDRSSIDAIFDLHAQSQVREYLVKLHAFGRTSDPQVILTAEPGLAESDILSLLTVGVTSRDQLADNTSSVSTGALLAADALFAASGLDKQVQRFIPQQVFRDLSFHLSTTYNDVSGRVEPAAQLESKFLTEQLKFEMIQPVSFRGTRAQLEYQFNEQLSSQLQWDNENASGTSFNVGADLKMRWEVE